MGDFATVCANDAGWGGARAIAVRLLRLWRENMTGISRRNLLKGAAFSAAGVAALGLAGCAPQTEATKAEAGLAETGELVNIDGFGNRVACLCSGPANVIIIAGMNKVVNSVEAGIERIRTKAAPPNTTRLGKNTPCAKTGVCGDCFSPDCICSQTVITRRSGVPGRIKIILVNEDLGF